MQGKQNDHVQREQWKSSADLSPHCHSLCEAWSETKRKTMSGDQDKTVRNRPVLWFPFWGGFPRKVISKGWPRRSLEAFYPGPRVSSRTSEGWGHHLTITLAPLYFPVTHTAVVTPLGTSYIAATHPGRGRFTCFVSTFAVYMLPTCFILPGCCDTCNSALGIKTQFMSFWAVEWCSLTYCRCWRDVVK